MQRRWIVGAMLILGVRCGGPGVTDPTPINDAPGPLDSLILDGATDAAPLDMAPADSTVVDSGPVDIAMPDLSRTMMPTSLSGVTVVLAGLNVRDCSTDAGGGVWAVTAGGVHYFPPGRGAAFQYDQSSGLARGQSVWKDIYYSGTEQAPQQFPVTFTAVAGATAGQAIVGNEGAIADRLWVDPSTGRVLRIDNMAVRPENSTPAEYPEHLKRVVATHSVVADLNGTYNGTAYVGGWHGFSAFHGLNGDCGCMPFEEHQHYLPGPPAQPNYCDDTPGDPSCWDGDVWGLAVSPEGDVWAGDRHFVQLLPQRSRGANAGLFETHFAVGIDVFPGVKDEVHGLAVDASGGVWVASATNGLGYVAPVTRTVRRWTVRDALPSDRLRGAAVDRGGDVWVGTADRGVGRYRPETDSWVSYDAGKGLPGNQINNVYFDKYGAGNRVLFCTDNGVGIYRER